MQLTWLSNEIGFFDVIMSTCFDRAMNPEAWLRRLPEVVKDGGLFVDVSNRFSDERDLEAVLCGRWVSVKSQIGFIN